MKYTTLLFDADDTLLDFKRAEHSALVNTLEKFSLPATDEIIAAYSEINIGLWRLLEAGGITKDELKIKRFALFCERFSFEADPTEMAHAYMDSLSYQSHLIDGAIDIVQKLFGKCRLYIITNGIKFIQRRRFSNTPIAEYFERIFISEDVGAEKPSEKYFEFVASTIPEFNKSETLVIGDSLSSDIKGGIDFGLDTCWYNPACKERPSNMDITYEIRELSQIYNIVAGD